MATAKKLQQKRHETASTASRKSPARKSTAARKPSAKTSKPAQRAKPEPAKTNKPDVSSGKKSSAGKLQRDTFRMTGAEFDGLRKLKTRAKALGVPARKSEILRAGLRTLQRMDDEHFAVLLAQIQNP